MKRPSKTRRPPISGQFRKRVSGNPKGRPKGAGARRNAGLARRSGTVRPAMPTLKPI